MSKAYNDNAKSSLFIRKWNQLCYQCPVLVSFCGAQHTVSKLSNEVVHIIIVCRLVKYILSNLKSTWWEFAFQISTTWTMFTERILVCALLLLFALRLFIGFVSIHRSFKLIRGYQIEHEHTHHAHLPAQMHCLWIICRSKSKFWPHARLVHVSSSVMPST